MVEEPPVAVGEHPLGGEHVEYCQAAVDRLAVARVQAESPVVARQGSDGLLEVVEGGAGQLGPGFAEALEVHCRQRQRVPDDSRTAGVPERRLRGAVHQQAVPRRVSPPALRLTDCQAAHGGVKTPTWVMMVVMSSAAHSSLILPSVIR